MQKRQQKSTKNKKRPQKLSQVMPVVASNFRSLSLVFPPRMNVKLKYWGIQVLSLAAATNANYRWRPTAAFDIDPALGGTSMAGFAELAGFYASYRVVSSRIKVTLANPSVLGTITMIVLPMNADPTNSFSAANVIASVGNPYAKTKLVGLLGAPPTVIQNVMTTTKIFGDPSVFYDHNFSSLVTTVPTNNWFWNVCLYSQIFVATPLDVQVEIEVDTEFYDRSFLPA